MMDGQGLLYILDLLGAVMQGQSLTIQQQTATIQQLRAQQSPETPQQPDPPPSPNGVPESHIKVN